MKDIEGFPKSRGAVAITDQIIRSCGSISAKIAEGFNRTQKKYLASLQVAVGEAAETENWLYKIRDASFLSTDRSNQRIKESIEIQRMIHGLIRSIRTQKQ